MKKVNRQNVISAIGDAIRFLESNQSSEGHWEDFELNVGPCTEWVTGYIGYALAQIIERTQLNLSISFLRKAATWLIKSQHKFGGWGFNRNSGVDADSTSSSLLFLKSMNLLSKEMIDVNVSILKDNQTENGGIGTYSINKIKDEKENLNPYFSAPLKMYKGWCSADTYVSAISILALLSLGFTNDLSFIRNAKEFIKEKQQPEGFWYAYWSNGKILGTFFCVEALNQLQESENVHNINHALQWIITAQSENGGWSDGLEGSEITPYDTALAVNTLLVKINNGHYDFIERGIGWLINNQLQDGSWAFSHLMKIPEPWDETQLDYPKNKLAVRDCNRLFTTATVLKTLTIFYQKYYL